MSLFISKIGQTSVLFVAEIGKKSRINVRKQEYHGKIAETSTISKKANFKRKELLVKFIVIYVQIENNHLMAYK